MYKRFISTLTKALRKAGVVIIRLYQLCISPLLAPRCRFNPSCSEYARLTIEHYGIFRGAWLTLKRLSKCHPLHQGGNDPIPTKQLGE